MRYVAACPEHGRVGHQFSLLFAARWFATAFDFQYRHASFVDGPSWGDRAAAWNTFFRFGRGVPTVAEVQDKYPSLRICRPKQPTSFQITYEQVAGIARGIPDEWLAVFPGYSMIWYNAYAWSPALFRDVCTWFQTQAFQSPEYQACAVDTARQSTGLTVAGYLRANGRHEQLPPHWHIDRDQFLAVISELRQHYRGRVSRPVVFTQDTENLHDSRWQDIDVRYCDDQYPAVLSAMKTCIEADIFIGSVGGTNSLIRTLRHNRKLSIGLQGRNRSEYPDGPNADKHGRFDFDAWRQISPRA